MYNKVEQREQWDAEQTIKFLESTIDEKRNVLGDHDAAKDIVRIKLVINDLKHFWNV